MEESRVVHRTEFGAIIGPLWVAGCMFTIGFAGLPWPRMLWAVLIWPYYLGRVLAG